MTVRARDKRLAQVPEIQVQTLLGKLAHVELKHAVGTFRCQFRHPGEVDLEVDQRDRRCNVELFVDFKEQQIDFDESEQAGRDFAADVEYRQWREQRLAKLKFIDNVFDDLADAHLAIAIGVKQIEFDLEKHAAACTAARDSQIKLGRRRQTAAEHELWQIGAGTAGVSRVVTDIEAVKDQQRVAESGVCKLLDTGRIESKGEVDVRGDIAGDSYKERSIYGNQLGVGKIEIQRRHVIGHQRDRLTAKQCENLRGIAQEREREAFRLRQLLGELFALACGPAIELVVKIEVRQDLVAPLQIGIRIRQVEVGIGPGGPVEDHEIAEVDDNALGFRWNRVGQGNNVGDRVKQRRIDLAKHAGEIDQCDRRTEVRDPGQRVREDVHDRLNRLGDRLDLLKDRCHEIADERPEIEPDVLEPHRLQAVLDGI